MAEGSRVTLALEEEVTPGVTPLVAWTEIRKNSDSLRETQSVVESGELRADRENASDIQGNLNIGGDITCELSFNSYQSLFESALADAWSTNSAAAVQIDVVAASRTFTRASGDYVADGFTVGMWVETAGFTNAANNGWFKITTLTTTVMTVAPPSTALVDETGSGDETVTNRAISGGTTNTYLSILKRLTDISEEVIYTGCLVDTMQITMEPDAVVGLVFGMNGRGITGPQAVGSAPTLPSTADPMASFSGEVYLDDVLNTNITAITLDLANNIADGFVVGSRFKVDQFMGRRTIGGNISFYFSALTDVTTTLAHTSRDLGFSMAEGGEYFGITLPRCYIDLTTPEVADEGPLTLEGPFRARLDSTLDESIIISTSQV